MLAQAAGLALLAAISPPALLLTAVYLGSARPRQTALCYLAGAALTATVIGVAALLALRAGHLDLHSSRTPRYGLRFGLGLVILAAAAVVAYRGPRRPAGARRPPGRMARLLATPGPAAALLAGAVTFGPSLTFIAAVQVIATARASDLLSAAGLVMVVVIDVMFVWLPFLAFLLAPEVTARRLGGFNGWLRAHGHAILTAALTVAGAILVADGLAGLISRA
ncbi:MAG: GAP family protein [Nocardiopsaceae bacterium]|nr:GAP family protein [Nocardiopsaceae bacterium]